LLDQSFVFSLRPSPPSLYPTLSGPAVTVAIGFSIVALVIASTIGQLLGHQQKEFGIEVGIQCRGGGGTQRLASWDIELLVKAILTSKALISQFLRAARARKILTVLNCAMGEKVSSKSIL
jgi:hypothetical protein